MLGGGVTYFIRTLNANTLLTAANTSYAAALERLENERAKQLKNALERQNRIDTLRRNLADAKTKLNDIAFTVTEQACLDAPMPNSLHYWLFN